MTDTITLPRAVGDEVRDLLCHADFTHFHFAAKRREMLLRAATALAALDAALAEPKKERAETGIPARSVGVGSGETDPSRGEAYREHITDGSPCWCNPELNYRDPETGAEVWVHRREQ